MGDPMTSPEGTTPMTPLTPSTDTGQQLIAACLDHVPLSQVCAAHNLSSGEGRLSGPLTSARATQAWPWSSVVAAADTITAVPRLLLADLLVGPPHCSAPSARPL